MAHGRTTLILAHRLSSVIGADRILVLDHGRVVESGRHAELIRRDEAPMRRLMGAPGRRTRGDDEIAFVEEAVGARDTGADEGTDYGVSAPAATAAAAAQVGARERRSRRWCRSSSRGAIQFAIVVEFGGSGRVAAFIGVGVVGALAVAAVKTDSPFGYLLILLHGLLAPGRRWPALDRILAGA